MYLLRVFGSLYISTLNKIIYLSIYKLRMFTNDLGFSPLIFIDFL